MTKGTKAVLYDREPSVDMHNQNLRDTNFKDADLRGANLEDADLRRANLCCANLNAANLNGANLGAASLRGTDLSGADLRGAKLRFTDLCGANLQGADLRCAIIRGHSTIDAGEDMRGYRFIGVQNRRGLHIAAGCNWFTLHEAMAHWKPREFPPVSAAECLGKVEMIAAEAQRRGWVV